jgi:outer membrane cobalamin receptor
MAAGSARPRATVLALALIVSLVSGVPAWPQQAPAPPPAPPTFELPEVEVAGKRPQLPSTTPASISVVTAAEIAAMGALTVADALRVLPESLVKASGGPGSLTTMSIRGSSSTQVLVLLDGVPLNRPDQPSVDLSTLPIQDVDHIEVLRGPFSAIYGSATLGGVVNIVTRSAPATRLSARAGSYGESSNVASFGGEIDNLTYLIQGILTGSTGFAPDTDYTNSTQVARLRWATGEDAGVTLTLDRLWHVTGAPGPPPFQDPRARLWEGRTLLDLAWRRGRPDGPGALLRVYGLDDNVSFVSPAIAFQSDDAAHLWGAQGQLVLAPWPRHLLTLGAEYQGQAIAHTDNSPAAFSNAGGDLGLYVQDDWQVSPRVLLSTGVREDVSQQFGPQVDPRVGVLVLLGDRLALRAGAGRAFRAPSFDELAPALFGNPNLLPETAWSYDLGLEYALAPGLTVSLTGYYKDATNLIVAPPPQFVPMNVGHAVVSGGSVDLLGQLTDRWFVRANLTGQHAYDAATGLDVVYVPRSLGNLELIYKAGPRTTLGTIVSYVGDRFADAANTQVVPGYWLTSLVATWAVGDGWQLQAGVANLFDVVYQESLGFPEPGRRYFVTGTKTF